MPLNTEHLSRCIETLESASIRLKQSKPGSVDYEIFRNATIKGFELVLELSGKLLKKALKPYFATSQDVDRLVFKDIFRHAAKHNLLTTAESERWFQYRDNRNTTAHDYGAAFVEETLILIEHFIKDANHLLKKLNHADT